MNHYPIAIGSDTGAIQLSSDGAKALGAAGGALIGLLLGQGKITHLAIGAGLGYVIGNTGMLQSLIGKPSAEERSGGIL